MSLKKIIIGVGAFLFSLVLIPLYYTYSEEVTLSDVPSLTAVLYDTSEYGSGSGTTLTEEGASVNDWLYNTSKYLQIDPNVPDDGSTYKIVVELSQEFYVLADELMLPSGYASVNFTKNEALSVNGDGKYYLEDFSGKIEFTMSKLQTSGTIQLELRYDNVLWDKMANSKLTPDGIYPIKVSFKKIDSSTNEETSLKTLFIKEATSGEAMTLALSSTFETPFGTIHGATYTAKLTDTITQKISLSSQITAISYYDKIVIEYTYPKYTDSDKNIHYLHFDESSIVLPYFASDTTEVVKQEDKIIITAYNAYFNGSSTVLLSASYMDVTTMLDTLGMDKITFSGGAAKVYVDSKNGNKNQLLKTVTVSSITYEKNLVEDVTMTHNNKPISLIERPDNAVSQIGGFYLENKGTGDSSAKTIFLQFDTANTGLIKVTTLNLPADNVQKYFAIEYTLVDDDNQLVYLNESGERVSSDTEGAISSWVYSLKNAYYNKSNIYNINNKLIRNMLPEKHQNYYFKTVKYTLSTIRSGSKLYAQSASSNITATGNIYAYVSSKVVGGEIITSKVTMTSADTNIATITKIIKNTLEKSSNSAYLVIEEKMSKTSIQAGESVILSARIKEITYPYGNSTWLKAITIGLILPEGVSVNESATTAQLLNKTNVAGITVETPISIGNGNYLWKIKLPRDLYIGYPTEEIKGLTSTSVENEAIDFSVQLDTAYTMNTSTLFAADMVFVAGYKQTNAAGGSYSYASKVDTYDLNENGSTEDRVGGIKASNTVSCQIIPTRATLDIESSITATHNGVISEESDNLNIYTPNDIVTYNLDIGCSNGGQVDDFEYYIPIPKMSNTRDDFLLAGTKEDSFGLYLQGAVNISGSDIFLVEYAFDTELDYENAKLVENWYTKEEIIEQNLSFQDVTMLKLTIVNGIIHNGDSSRIALNLKYEGNEYEVSAGKVSKWSSGGFFHYLNNGREVAGNFSTNQVTVNLNYILDLDDIVLTASKDMIPQGEGNVNEVFVSNKIPQFIKEQNFVIESVETYNVKLQTNDYVKANVTMPGIEANQTFAITVTLNDGIEYDILTDTVINIGTNSENTIPKFKYKLYNADALTENIQSRYIIVKYKSDNGVVLNQKIIINREITKASEVSPSIVAGNSYTTLNEVASKVNISKNSSFTAQFATEHIPNLYDDQKIVFSSNIPVGTTITFINIRENTSPTYWYYIVTSENLKEISLNQFQQMGKTSNSNYSYITGDNTTKEQFNFVVDFSKCTTYLSDATYTVKLVFTGTNVDNFNSTSLSFTTYNSRTFELNANVTNVNIGNEFNISYNLSEVTVNESIYVGKKLSLILKASNNLPLDSYISNNGNKYYLNSNNEFIIPLSDVQNGSGNISLELHSNILTDEKIDYLLDMELWVSATANANLPRLGQLVARNQITIINPEKVMPSLKITGMKERIIKVENLYEKNILSFEYLRAGNNTVTIELHQKVGSGYQLLTNALNEVNGSTTHTMGVFDVDAIEGLNEVTFKLSSILQNGTYRMIIKVYDSSSNLLLEVPYNFMIVK